MNQLTIDGIKRFGVGWRSKISLPVPKDVPSLFAEIETNFEIIKLGHKIASDIVSQLKTQRSKLPNDSLDELDDIIKNLECSLIYEDIKSLESWSAEDLGDIASDVKDSLIAELNALYDWAGYYRVLFNTK